MLAFPSLFRRVQGDPINNETIPDINSKETESFPQKLCHLFNYEELINGKWVLNRTGKLFHQEQIK